MKTKVKTKVIEILVIETGASELITNMIVGSMIQDGGLLDIARDGKGKPGDYCDVLDNLSAVHAFANAMRSGMKFEASIILKDLLGEGGIHPKLALCTLNCRVKDMLLKGMNTKDYVLEVQNDLGSLPFTLKISSHDIFWQ